MVMIIILIVAKLIVPGKSCVVKSYWLLNSNLNRWYRLCGAADTEDVVKGSDRFVVDGNWPVHVPQAPLVFLVGAAIDNVAPSPLPPLPRWQRWHLGRAAARTQRLFQRHWKGTNNARIISKISSCLSYI